MLKGQSLGYKQPELPKLHELPELPKLPELPELPQLSTGHPSPSSLQVRSNKAPPSFQDSNLRVMDVKGPRFGLQTASTA